jgi:ketosteroid isomerase-like protein
MTIEQNKAVALRFLETMGGNDPEGTAACFAPGGAAVTMGTGQFSGRREAAKVVGAVEAFKTLMPTGLRFTIKTVTAEGERVVIEAAGNATTSAGTAYANNYVFVFAMQDGKIAEVREYFCTRYADEVLWPIASQVTELATSD